VPRTDAALQKFSFAHSSKLTRKEKLNVDLTPFHGPEGYDNEAFVTACNTGIAILSGIQPKDEIEGMLAVQMITVHNVAMETLGRAMISGQTFDGKQVAVLYGAGKYFLCRHGYDLCYTSQQETEIDRMMRKKRKIRDRLGASHNLSMPIWRKPKGMHWKTFDRLQDQEEEINKVKWG
jgi:hypothetical protein